MRRLNFSLQDVLSACCGICKSLTFSSDLPMFLSAEESTLCDVIVWVCGVIVWVCGVIVWVCGVIVWGCSVIVWVCSVGM